jgi:SAM-dependent methyltransferase
METFLRFPHEVDPLPERFRGGSGDDVRTPEAYVEHFLEAYTDPGDAVVDPFAGFGTTLRVAERLDRAAYGLEYEPERVRFVRERVAHPERVVRGSALDLPGALASADPPAFDCCLTSPPYMVRGMRRNPLANYADDSRTTYGAYLEDVTAAFEALGDLMAPDGHLLVDVANLKYDGRVTRLAWDLADRLGAVYPFEGEVVIGWEGGDEGATASEAAGDEGAYGYGYDHSYCLVFAVGD